jgi:hypothetical protein
MRENRIRSPGNQKRLFVVSETLPEGEVYA